MTHSGSPLPSSTYAKETYLVTTTHPPVSDLSVACSSSSVNSGRFVTCTATVSGTSPSGNVNFTTNSNTGRFLPFSGKCTLTASSCAVSYTDTASYSTVKITGSYAGDSNHPAGSASFSLSIGGLANLVAIGASSLTLMSGNAYANQTSTTGLTVSISGSAAPDGTSIIVNTQALSSPSVGVAALSLSSLRYFDVLVKGITTGNARVCAEYQGTTATTSMQYWDGRTWTGPASVTMTGTVVCGTIPVSALTGTNIALGNPVQQAAPFPIVSVATNPVVVVLVILIAVYVAYAVLSFRKHRKQKRLDVQQL